MLSKFKNKKLLIFDFDGTLSNTSYIHESSFKKALAKINIELDFNYSSIAGTTTKDAFLIIAKLNPTAYKAITSNLEILIQNKKDIARSEIFSHAKPFPGVDDFLRWAKKHDFTLAIASSGSRINIIQFLKKFDLFDLFSLVKSSEDCINNKPNPEIFNAVLKELSFPASKAFIFEDSILGKQAAEAAKVDFDIVDETYWANLKIYE